ncbi:SulP family inorganic anion transporter [Legionella anisa]|uniref:SulP family inorganic anion transporter n=2 Tax=Legionella anisa TaxID=28082 RepID=A0AAX0WT84_9GAMM|nr:SulP family inorganic anion transporter [Legionella anisa]AWN74832.1 SulP family inorganic anion transporter [Legionella anisa]KTC77701.1 sulfate transporter [Legionella anisa]MCW8424970.1 SulP family inorganic anion transporter [Legionella anisa]MCW8445910.1 SulP family inorganic anion transporter [Legionella anisa]PNL61210.1 SulP family inorganic anion transporter [Legionella anisa]
MIKGIFSNLKYDFQASIVVFLVALPLCLGIALASEAPLFSGIIAGIIGGAVVGFLSGSALGVSGPAAGLVAIVLSAQQTLGSWKTFLLAGFIAGIFQIVAGFLRGGIIAYYFPSSVIKGMLSGIGIIIILKQVPHLIGYDVSPILTDLTDGRLEFFYIKKAVENINFGVVIISMISLLIMVSWQYLINRGYKLFEMLQAPLVVVLCGLVLSFLYKSGWLSFHLEPSQLVQVPEFKSIADLTQAITLPNFNQLTNMEVYQVAAIIALVSSLETLLCVEATDKLDPYKRVTPTDRELKAQGLGNMLSSLIGGLPITQVIIRSSTNITFGAKTKLSTILHGVLLLVCVLTIPMVLNQIPLASLAAILVMIGYKLASPSVFKQMYQMGWEQFLPFIVTVIGIIVNDLLFGIGVGFAVAIFIILRHHYLNAHDTSIVMEKGMVFHVELAEEVSFLNKGSIIHQFRKIPPKSMVIIDSSRSKYIDNDVQEVINNFSENAKTKEITVEMRGVLFQR